MTDDSPPPDDSIAPVAASDASPIAEPTTSQNLTEGSSVEPAPVDVPQLEIRTEDGPRRWYLGIAEAICWFMGTLFVHITTGVAVLIALVVVTVIRTGNLRADFQNPQSMIVVTAGEMILFVLASMLAVSVRYWGRTFKEINFSWPEPKHVAIVVGGTLPLSLCVSVWSMPLQLGWDYIKEIYPALEFFDSMNTMELVKEISQTTPVPIMILVVAVLPAIGEELIFRFAIGRVLIAHIGFWGGVLLTSFLFGWIHVHPVHALSVMPLGLAMHLIYVWTRSFWMPMLLHFLNNSWAVMSVKLDPGDLLSEGVHLTMWEGLEMITAAIAVTALTIGLWQSQVRYIQDDGREWVSPRFPIRVPPSATFHRRSPPMNSACWYTALISVILCHSMVGFGIVNSLIDAN